MNPLIIMLCYKGVAVVEGVKKNEEHNRMEDSKSDCCSRQ